MKYGNVFWYNSFSFSCLLAPALDSDRILILLERLAMKLRGIKKNLKYKRDRYLFLDLKDNKKIIINLRQQDRVDYQLLPVPQWLTCKSSPLPTPPFVLGSEKCSRPS